MRKIGYARVSTQDQSLEVQRRALGAAGCHIVLEEKITGTRRQGREQLDLALKLLTQGDMLVVTRLDRLGRSMRDLANIVFEIEGKGASLHVTEQEVDTATPAGRAFFGMLSVFAQFETDVRAERQREGIARAKLEFRDDGKPKYAGRAKKVNYAAIREALSSGARPSQIARDLGINRSTVYNAKFGGQRGRKYQQQKH